MAFNRFFLKCGITVLIATTSSCQDLQNSDQNLPTEKESVANKETKNKVDLETNPAYSDLKRKNATSLMQLGLVNVRSINSSIYVELKYATADNFMKMKLYDTLTHAFLQEDVALRLSKCQEFLNDHYGDFHLLIYDAVRPISVQKKMWIALDSIPISERSKFVSNPANGSIHNYGAAVDLTICNAQGVALDMGAGYDDIRKIAYPSLELQFLKSGELSKQQLENRKMLRNVMESQNFRNIPTEWWHFNACSRSTAKAKYKPLY
ncbi:MAG: M15 family metallopeptidase [Crocinitomicaceae bacterium]